MFLHMFSAIRWGFLCRWRALGQSSQISPQPTLKVKLFKKQRIAVFLTANIDQYRLYPNRLHIVFGKDLRVEPPTLMPFIFERTHAKGIPASYSGRWDVSITEHMMNKVNQKFAPVEKRNRPGNREIHMWDGGVSWSISTSNHCFR